jgi:hypothetical protein
MPLPGGEAQEDVEFDGAKGEEAVDREWLVHVSSIYALCI